MYALSFVFIVLGRARTFFRLSHLLTRRLTASDLPEVFVMKCLSANDSVNPPAKQLAYLVDAAASARLAHTFCYVKHVSVYCGYLF